MSILFSSFAHWFYQRRMPCFVLICSKCSLVLVLHLNGFIWKKNVFVKVYCEFIVERVKSERNDESGFAFGVWKQNRKEHFVKHKIKKGFKKRKKKAFLIRETIQLCNSDIRQWELKNLRLTFLSCLTVCSPKVKPDRSSLSQP